MTTAILTPIFAQLARGLSTEYGLDEAAILTLCQDVMKSCAVKVSNVDETPGEAPKAVEQKCSWVMKKGKHDGETCTRNAVDGGHCKQHALLAAKEKSKPEPEKKPKCTYIFTRGDNIGKQCTSNAVNSTMPIHVVACSSHEKSLYQKALKDQEAAGKSGEVVDQPIVQETPAPQPIVQETPAPQPIVQETPACVVANPPQEPEKKQKKRTAPKKK